MLRPSLCLATARAFGATEDDALLSAVAIELLHNAILIHDDIEDASEQRRGRPTLHALHGVPLALNAGDMLTLLQLAAAQERPGPPAASHRARHLRGDRTHGVGVRRRTGLDLGWRREEPFDLTDADYLTMVCKKTCWLGMIIQPASGR